MQLKHNWATLWKSDTFRVRKMETMTTNNRLKDQLDLIDGAKLWTTNVSASRMCRLHNAPTEIYTRTLVAEIAVMRACEEQRQCVEALHAWVEQQAAKETEVQS